MVAMWKRMGEYFGQSWVREYGESNGEPIKAWTEALNGFSEAQIARGVKWCQTWTQPFPPNLGQFKNLCLTMRQEELPNATEERIAMEKAAGKPIAMIEHLARVATSDIAKREIERMKQIYAGKEVETKAESWAKLGLHARWGRGEVKF